MLIRAYRPGPSGFPRSVSWQLGTCTLCPAQDRYPYYPEHGRDGACMPKGRIIDTIINALLDYFYRTEYMT